ncbi:hypothetical protein ABFS83_06G039800 [Erythranthe nasuta]
MGKDWLHWIVGGGGGGGGGRSSARRRRRRTSGEMEEAAATSAGCMCAVFHLFDLHHFHHFPLNHQTSAAGFRPTININPSLHEEATTSKGAEAPRNSLEVEEEAAGPIASAAINAACSSSKPLPIKEEANLNFPIGIQIIKTPRVSISGPKSRTSEFSSESSCNSPGIKTPTLVARLMGLDLLPSESNSPSKPTPKIKQSSNRAFLDHDFSAGIRSLPETPRVSSARRSDVDYHHHHRLSLQINRDNTSEEEYFAEKTAAGRRGRRVTQDENSLSAGQYAKQIVKNVREKVSRRVVGADITNTTGRNKRDDENLIPPKKSPRLSSRFEGETEIVTADHVRDSNSPRLKFSDTNKNKSNNKSPRSSVSSSSDTNHNHDNKQQHKENKNAVVIVNGGKCNSSSSTSSRVKKLMPRQASDHTIKNKKDEAFVHSTTATNKSKKASFLSSEILHISSPTLVQIKRDPSPPLTKLPPKQVKLQKQVSDAPSSEKSTQLSSKPSHSYKQPDNLIFSRLQENVRHIPDSATPLRGGAATEYRDYIQIIFQRAGIINNPLNLPKWCAYSQPIDPSIFHHVELFHPTTTVTVTGGNSILSHRCNRKLIFQLANELLGEITRPRFVIRPSISQICDDSQFRLVDELCKRIDDFPAANCLVLEDIDSLIDRDLRQPQLNGRFEEEEEKESIVCEIEGEIMAWLVRETVVAMGAAVSGGGANRTEPRVADDTWRATFTW